MENVVVLSFAGTDQAWDGLRWLKRLHETDDLQLEAAAVVERAPNGEIVVVEVAEDFHVRATAAGGLIGALIGVLTGPIGLVIGGATGAAVGSLVDVADAESADALLRIFGQAVPPGSAAAIAVLFEKTPAAVDGLAVELEGTVLRRPRADVEYEIAEAEEAAIAARREAEGKRAIGDRLRDIKDAVLDRR